MARKRIVAGVDVEAQRWLLLRRVGAARYARALLYATARRETKSAGEAAQLLGITAREGARWARDLAVVRRMESGS